MHGARARPRDLLGLIIKQSACESLEIAPQQVAKDFINRVQMYFQRPARK
jgi:hypothetical protein